MKVLAINCGSSTLKFQLIDMWGEDTPYGQEQQLARGVVDRIGGRGVAFVHIASASSRLILYSRLA